MNVESNICVQSLSCIVYLGNHNNGIGENIHYICVFLWGHVSIISVSPHTGVSIYLYLLTQGYLYICVSSHRGIYMITEGLKIDDLLYNVQNEW